MASVFGSSDIKILDDTYMKDKGFDPLDIEEKIKLLSYWIKKAKRKKAKLKSQKETTEFYGPKTPRPELGETKRIKEIEWLEELNAIEHSISNQKVSIESLHAEYEYWMDQKAIEEDRFKDVNSSKGSISVIEKKELPDKIKNRIKVFADTKREENQNYCITLLSVFEQNRDELINNSYSSQLRFIKDQNEFSFKEKELPTSKILREWLRDYISKYPPK